MLLAEDDFDSYVYHFSPHCAASPPDHAGTQRICYNCNFAEGVAASPAVQAAWRMGGYDAALRTFIDENLRKARK